LRPGRLLHAGRKLGLGARKIDGQVFEAELELILIEPLGASAELAALQLLDDEVQPLDLGLCFGKGRALGAAASERTSCCSVSTSFGRAARSISMRTESS
jgi:hypothetical protein